MPAGLQEGRAVTDQKRGNATPLASHCDPLLSTHRGTRPSQTFGVKTMWFFLPDTKDLECSRLLTFRRPHLLCVRLPVVTLWRA